MSPMDDTLVAIVTAPVSSIPDVVASLEAIDRALPDNDGLKWFNWLYLAVTRAVDVDVTSSEWQSQAWIASLDVVFARLYLDALKSSLTPGSAPPQCWQVLFSRRNDTRLARIQFAIAGINAHIDHDLPRAVVENCQIFNGCPAMGSAEYRDYTRINGVLDPIILEAKKELLTGLAGIDLPELDLVENLVGAWSIAAVREAAWTNSEMLWSADEIPGLGARFLEGLDNATALAGLGLLAPVGV